jgi:hypothetical protein
VARVGPLDEARQGTLKRQADFADGAVALLGQQELGADLWFEGLVRVAAVDEGCLGAMEQQTGLRAGRVSEFAPKLLIFGF